jgi:hypothetical protein
MEFTIESWAHLQEVLFQDTWDGELQRHRSSYIYRGMNDYGFGLETSLMRLGGSYEKLENHLLRNFRKYAHRDQLTGDSAWNWLALAQHHGLPTRLLDWTYSPYIALHFATNDLKAFNDDAVIWGLNYVSLNRQLPRPLKEVISTEMSNVFTVEMLGTVCKGLEGLAKMSDEVFLLFFEPPSLDDRIVNQHALFALLSDPTTRMEDWLSANGENDYFRIRIPAELKWEIRDKLDQANITERVLFPGLGGLSQWLKRHYSPRR